jgi:hypothetical protein
LNNASVERPNELPLQCGSICALNECSGPSKVNIKPIKNCCRQRDGYQGSGEAEQRKGAIERPAKAVS